MQPIVADSPRLTAQIEDKKLLQKTRSIICNLRAIAPLNSQEAVSNQSYRDCLAKLLRLSAKVSRFAVIAAGLGELNSVESYIVSQSERLISVLAEKKLSSLQTIVSEYAAHGVSLSTFKVAFKKALKSDLDFTLAIIFLRFAETIRNKEACSYCLEEFDKKEFCQIAITDCHHFFHNSCYKQISKLSSCPNCRKEPLCLIPPSLQETIFNENRSYFIEISPPLLAETSTREKEMALFYFTPALTLGTSRLIETKHEMSEDERLALQLAREEELLLQQAAEATRRQVADDLELAQRLNEENPQPPAPTETNRFASLDTIFNLFQIGN